MALCNKFETRYNDIVLFLFLVTINSSLLTIILFYPVGETLGYKDTIYF